MNTTTPTTETKLANLPNLPPPLDPVQATERIAIAVEGVYLGIHWRLR